MSIEDCGTSSESPWNLEGRIIQRAPFFMYCKCCNFSTASVWLATLESKNAVKSATVSPGMQSARSGDCVLPPAGARRYEANHRGVEGEHWAQYARVRR